MSYRPLVDWYVNDFGLTVVNIALMEILTLKSLMPENPETIITPKIVQWTYEMPKKEIK